MIYILPILAVMLSFGFVATFKPKNKKAVKLLLAFSGAFLLSLTVFDLLPEIYTEADSKTIGIFIMLGILLQIFLEFFSKGAEHGHVHFKADAQHFPWLVFASLSLHSMLEGLPISDHHSLLIGILIHKIPIAVILSIFFTNAKISLKKAFFFMLLFAVMTPIGTMITSLTNLLSDYTNIVTALAVGVFLHISTVILFESSEGHSFNLSKVLVIILGISIAYII